MDTQKRIECPVGRNGHFAVGLANSNNWISARLANQYTETLVKLMQSFGIRGHPDPVVSLALGPCEVSVSEMVDAYTAFPSKGIRVDPLYVTRIEDSNGKCDWNLCTQKCRNIQRNYRLQNDIHAAKCG